MQSIGFEGSTLTVPKSDAVHFDFRNGSLFLVCKAFTGEVQLSSRTGGASPLDVVEKQATSPDCVLNLPSTGKKAHQPALKTTPETSTDEAEASEEAESSRPELPPRLEDSPSDSQGGESPAPTESDAPLKRKPSLSIESADAIEGEIQRGNPAKRTSSALYPLFHNTQPRAPSPKRKLVVGKGCPTTRRSTGKENEGAPCSSGQDAGVRVEWSLLQPTGPVPEARWGASATLMNGQLYLFGGASDEETLSDLWTLRLDNWTWSRPSISLPTTPRAWHSATAVGQRLLVFGGERTHAHGNSMKTTSFNDVSVFDTDAMVWFAAHTTGQPPTARAGHSATALTNGQILIFGGISGSKWLNDASVLNTGSWSWSRPVIKGTPPKARCYQTATQIGSRVVIFGGNGSKQCFREVHVLDTASWTWSQPEVSGEAPKARTGQSAVAQGSRVVIFGGWDYSDSYSSSKVYNDVSVLDTETWTWMPVQLMSGEQPTPRCGHGSSLVVSSDGKNAVVFTFGGQIEREEKVDEMYLLRLDA
ncbi:hypothetical protein KFL_005750070 [Klebsormidium nitens]|uniref:Uncharacterized protein n=1 Tax=Klebsormidium nitens TaxID=105231 RepID=A0A1Y1IM90_KLENI|nr:hypothetical protein KFL_005750070 [Klebsormidium nitens]|eukprot:GAQ89906.1 hypothetical protein KFL_005750070 [Klebsormidium nitens]